MVASLVTMLLPWAAARQRSADSDHRALLSVDGGSQSPLSPALPPPIIRAEQPI
jgi:hypothetical protein